MEIVIIWFVLSILVGLYAGSRGRGSGNWFVVSLLLSPLIGLIFVAALPNLKDQPNEKTHRKCPECAEQILIEAKTCKHCGHRLVEAGTPT